MANYDINYDDPKFTQVESDKNQALTEIEQTYGGMISESDKYYQAQIDASKQWADKQSQIQQENTDFIIEKIEQDKAQAGKDYTKEQSGAYVDWQKQSNQFGANAEAMAMNGMANTGYSESSQVAMYTAYQNRVASSRESYNQVVLNYNNSIKEAQLQNNSKLAEISYQTLQQQLELLLQGFQYKNNLLLEQMNKKQEIDNQYYNRYQDVLAQMNKENALAEEIRQFEQSYSLQVKEYEEKIRQFNEEMARLKKKDEEEYALQIQELELKKQSLEEEKRQFDLSYELQKQQYNASRSSSGGSGGGYSYIYDGGSGGDASVEKKSSAPVGDVPYAIKNNKPKTDGCNNNATTQAKSDYYIKGTSQPQYYNNQKLTSSSTNASVLGKNLGLSGSIMKSGNKYYAWNGSSYIDVTSNMVFSNGYQPRYIGNTKLTSVGTIKVTMGSYGSIPSSQNVWKAGSKYYVWNGKTKSYVNVTSQFNTAQRKNALNGLNRYDY